MIINLLSILLAAQTAPADPSMNWLLEQATTAPATQPADEAWDAPAPVLANPARDAAWRDATITLSNGERVRGRVTTTLGKPIRIYDLEREEFRDFAWNLIERFDATVQWERIEKEWKFRESASDIREYSGRTYPARLIQYTLTLKNGKTASGGIVAPLYIEKLGSTDTLTLVIHKRQKGEIGQTLDQLVYIQSVDFAPRATTRPATQPATTQAAEAETIFTNEE